MGKKRQVLPMVGGSGVGHQGELTSKGGWFLEIDHTKALSCAICTGSLRYRGHTAAGGTEARHRKGLPDGGMDRAAAYTTQGVVPWCVSKELETHGPHQGRGGGELWAWLQRVGFCSHTSPAPSRSSLSFAEGKRQCHPSAQGRVTWWLGDSTAGRFSQYI